MPAAGAENESGEHSSHEAVVSRTFVEVVEGERLVYDEVCDKHLVTSPAALR
jgi:hypothetical protein